MPEPTNSYQISRSDSSEFTGEFIGTESEAAAWGAELAQDLGWGEDWQLEERHGRQVVAIPSAVEPGYMLIVDE
ncbi:hypothetical protein [Mumia zhuanghuii]|uniref:Uncharacterized protein n=1 Tax=Mumia zhuanghuii TaxID=2585211 RepID=A0A5C4MJH0_9ACTN|nr:hypothetical protein [Mumia zhuanghuii]TNC44655.1 hypothetical protein FHE65_16515 [Mumia zhuanghuii]TNC51029.1 hypothetical protein FHE65_02340 [Mumia zhuanghuii]